MEKRADSGQAYGFFQCDASSEEIKATLPKIRNAVGTPSNLELDLIDGPENLKGDERLTALARDASEAGLNYVLQATYPKGTNSDAAEELTPIFNQAYQSQLYEGGKEWAENSGIFYEMDKEYVLRPRF